MNEKSVQQKLEFLHKLDLQSEAGLKTLISALDDPILEIRAQAYVILSHWKQTTVDSYSFVELEDPSELRESRIQLAFEKYAAQSNLDLDILYAVGACLNRGVKINPGETIYCVYASALTYGDDFYHLHDQLDSDDYLFPDDYDDSDDEYYNPGFQYACLDLEVAEFTAHQLHNQTALQLYSEKSGTMLFMIDGSTAGLPKELTFRELVR